MSNLPLVDNNPIDIKPNIINNKSNTMTKYYKVLDSKMMSDGIVFTEGENKSETLISFTDDLFVYYQLIPDCFVAEVEFDVGQFIVDKENNNIYLCNKLILKNIKSCAQFKDELISQLLTRLQSPRDQKDIKKEEAMKILNLRWNVFNLTKDGLVKVNIKESIQREIRESQERFIKARQDPNINSEVIKQLMDDFNKISLNPEKKEKLITEEIQSLLCVFSFEQKIPTITNNYRLVLNDESGLIEIDSMGLVSNKYPYLYAELLYGFALFLERYQ